MLITLCYVYLWVRFHKCYSVLIRHRLSRPTGGGSLSFSLRSGSAPTPSPQTGHRAGPPLPGGGSGDREDREDREDSVFLQLGDKSVCVIQPQVCDDLSTWTVLLGSSVACGPRLENISFIIEATGQRAGHLTSHTSSKKVLKWSDCCLPLARSPGQPFRAVAQASLDNFSRLGVAFIEDRLQLDKGLVPSKIVPVLLQESTLSELWEKQQPQQPSSSPARPVLSCQLAAEHPHLSSHKGSISSLDKRRLEDRRGSEPIHSTRPHHLGLVGDLEDQPLGSHLHMKGHGHHLHLSSCHECLELESSTILSVKYASADNIPDLPDDDSAELGGGTDSLDGLEHDTEGAAAQNHHIEHFNKLPNILVYTNGSQERFQVVHQVLTECLNMENYIIYPLQPQQALNDPWQDTTRLLVLAEKEALTPQLQTLFLNYLSTGGRVLGLASTLCPAGLSLEVRGRASEKVQRLNFTREDRTQVELSLLTSGKVYLRDVSGGGEVELWGEIKVDSSHQREMVIVRVTHGEDGGEAVCCQVHLEIAPHSTQNLTADCFDELKVSNTLRYEVMAEILASLGLECEKSQTASEPTPVHLLSASQEAKAGFLKWLLKRSDQTGLLTSSKTSLRMMSCSDLRSEPTLVPSGPLPLLVDSPEPHSWENFCMGTYSRNLQTHLLGRTVLYGQVLTSTMDLLEGLNVHLPEDAGLIVIAGRQSQGRGRGRNAWLSPPGCAMFTLSVRVELSSRLGQRIPFLQHLAALAVVEAVRTLPGYQDIDLRLKWPNDIYYSNLMKIGGVLVTSSVVGSTFHLLIGCGINVTNSNPTVCINDLIQRYNAQHGCSLQPLSCSQLIARSLGCLEELMGSFQRGGPEAVLPAYYRRWLHSGTQVQLWSEDGPRADVLGLDSNGFLQVRSPGRDIISLEPDGNSFDMLKNLVAIKLS